MTCYNCNGKGHTARVCPSKKNHRANEAVSTHKNGKKKEKAEGSKKETAHEANIEEAWVATSCEQPLAPLIRPLSPYTSVPLEQAYSINQPVMTNIFDSGASTHMTPHLD